jgi:hypothetical protein
MLVPKVSRERRGADQPCGEPPGDAHLAGRRRIGERREGDAGDGVDDGNQMCFLKAAKYTRTPFKVNAGIR